MTRRRSARVLLLAAALTPLFVAFYAVAQPWYLDWGATTAELRKTLPGDEIIPDARSQHTRAITIHADVERVWPWLAQLGQDRGGFYSFDVLENVVGCRMPIEDYLRPDKQSWAIGDKLWMYPPDRAGGVGFATLRALVRGHALGFATRSTGTTLSEPEDGSWSMVLEPLDGESTRLLIRGRLAHGRSALGAAFDASVFAPMHYVMERRMMIGIKQLAEGSSRERMLNHAQVLLWTVTFVLFLVAGWRVLHGMQTTRSLLAVIAAGAVFQILTFVQPSILVGETLVIILLALLWWPLQTPHTPAFVEAVSPTLRRADHRLRRPPLSRTV